MPFLSLLLLALVQGITEFLPISSSGHLLLTWELLHRLDPTMERTALERLDLDIAVHVGTLLAVLLYFHRDVFAMVLGFFKLLAGRLDAGARLVGLLLVATLPVLLAGYLLHRFAPTALRGLEVMVWANILFAILLWLADRLGMLILRVEHLRLGPALFIGILQVLALIPGVSRSGITMTAGRILGLERPEAARFSLLLSIPAIAGAGFLAGLDLYESGNLALGHDALIAAALSFLAALLAIALMMRWLKRASFAPFVIYRLLLGALLLWLLYG